MGQCRARADKAADTAVAEGKDRRWAAASVKRNWYAIMPESAEMGDRGRVVLDFKIQRDGSVPDPDPQMMSSSQKEPLDRAASSAIRASSPFEPLPSEFSGPYIELRFIFLYNIPLSDANQPQ